MSDASEHLAPVSYLPWATPPEQDAGSPASAPVSAPAEAPAPAPAPARARARDRFGAAGVYSGRRGRLSAVAHGIEQDETGPERDARIDRLVVSRLRRSSLSVSEVRAVLAEHGLDEAEIEEWIDRYERLGYLDDARLAEQLVHVNGSRRGRGSGAIMQELTRRGVDASAARAAVDELDPEVERRNAMVVAERRARQLTGLERQTAERRLSAFLQRRGYPGDVVREAVAAALAADGS